MKPMRTRFHLRATGDAPFACGCGGVVIVGAIMGLNHAVIKRKPRNPATRWNDSDPQPKFLLCPRLRRRPPARKGGRDRRGLEDPKNPAALKLLSTHLEAIRIFPRPFGNTTHFGFLHEISDAGDAVGDAILRRRVSRTL